MLETSVWIVNCVPTNKNSIYILELSSLYVVKYFDKLDKEIKLGLSPIGYVF